MDVFKPDSGEFLIDKKPFHPKNHKIGYLPEERGMYNKIPILDQLIYFAKLRGMDTLQAKKNALRYLETVELEDFAKKELGTLSKGNQQKIQLIQTVIHKPEILILDEPGIPLLIVQVNPSVTLAFQGNDVILKWLRGQELIERQAVREPEKEAGTTGDN